MDSFKQMKSGDILGGIASSTNTVTGVISGLASNQGTKLPLSAVNADNTVGKDNVKLVEATNNFYANAGVNLGFNKSSSNSKSHSESGVVTTIKGKDENSSITYSNVKNIEYVGTQTQNTKFIYNNVENITKRAVELNNYSSSSSKSSGVSAGVTIGYGDGVQTEANAISISASKSKMNTDGTTYQNGLFVNVDEVHNNTKNMTLSGFNQIGGKVTGNIQNLTIESKQNTSTTTGSTKSGSIGFAPNGMPNSISANYSKTNGERKYVDDPTTFIIGDGSNLKVGKVDNTAGAIGATENGKLSIDEYVGHNLENNDETTTKGASLSLSPNKTVISGVGINYANKDLESVTKNTVIGNVEIGKSSGAEINKDLGSMTEITKDRDFKTDINIESQTINYIKNPEKFKEDLQKAKSEINDIYHAAESTIKPKGKETRSPVEQLGEVRQAKVILNVIGSRLDIAENQDEIAAAFEGVSEDLGYKVKVIYTDPSKSPQLIGVDKNGNKYIKDGTAYVDKKTGIGYILVNTESPANSTKAGVIGTIAEEQSHVIGKFEGRQKVVPDESEKGLESLGRPTNDYFKNQYSKNDKAIGLKSDGRDYSNVDFGEHVGDGEGFAVFKASLYRAVSSYPIIYKKDDIEMDPIGMTKEYKKLENEISLTLEEENFDISSKRVHTKLSEIAEIGGTGYTSSPYEGLYVIDNEDVRRKILDKDNNLHLEKFDPPSWKKLEQSTLYKNGVENLKRKAQEKYEKNKDIINKKPNSSSTSKKDKFDEALDEMERVHNFMVSLATPRNDENDIYEINEIVSFETPSSDEKDIYKVRENVKFASLNEGKIKNNLEYALGNSTLVGTIFMKDGIPYLRYNLSDTFEDITGIKRKAGVELEYGKPYDMLGPSKEIPLFDEKGMKK